MKSEYEDEENIFEEILLEKINKKFPDCFDPVKRTLTTHRNNPGVIEAIQKTVDSTNDPEAVKEVAITLRCFDSEEIFDAADTLQKVVEIDPRKVKGAVKILRACRELDKTAPTIQSIAWQAVYYGDDPKTVEEWAETLDDVRKLELPEVASIEKIITIYQAEVEPEIIKELVRTLLTYKRLGRATEVARVLESISWKYNACTVGDVARRLRQEHEIIPKTLKKYNGLKVISATYVLERIAEEAKELPWNLRKVVEELGQDDVLRTLGKYQRLKEEGVNVAVEVAKEIIDTAGVYDNLENIARALGQEIVLKTLREYQGSKGAEEVVNAIIDTAQRTGNPEITGKVAEILLEYLESGEADEVAQAIKASSYTSDEPRTVSEVIENVIKTFRAYKGLEAARDVARAIKEAADRTDDIRAVTSVTETLLAYKGSEKVGEVARAIEKTALKTRNVGAIKKVTKYYLNELRTKAQ